MCTVPLVTLLMALTLFGTYMPIQFPSMPVVSSTYVYTVILVRIFVSGTYLAIYEVAVSVVFVLTIQVGPA